MIDFPDELIILVRRSLRSNVGVGQIFCFVKVVVSIKHLTHKIVITLTNKTDSDINGQTFLDFDQSRFQNSNYSILRMLLLGY